MPQATAVEVLVLAGTKDGIYLLRSDEAVSYTHLTLPTNREV